MTQTQPVGLIGLGLLGQALAHRLTGAGFAVAGYDIDPAKTAKLAELGGQPASSISELAKRCAPIVLAVFSTDQVEEVVERELLPALGDGSNTIVLCASTCDPDRIAALNRARRHRAASVSWKRRSPARAGRWRAARASA